MATGDAANPREEKARTFFQYGNDAALKSNFDYAIDMYKQACKLAPDNLSYRQALRGITRRKFNNDPSKVGRLVGARMQPIRMSARSSKNKGKFGESLATCEDGFTHNPWDVETARIASEAAEGLGLNALAEWLLESVHAQGRERRRLPPPRGAGPRGERVLGQVDRLLGADQEDPPQRPGSRPQGQRDGGQGHDQEVGAGRGPRRALEARPRGRGPRDGAGGAEAQGADARATGHQGDRGQPPGRRPLPRPGRHLPPRGPARRGRAGPRPGASRPTPTTTT